MKKVFSNYVARLSDAGEPPSAEAYTIIRKVLCSVLISKLKNRDLWHRPPRYLGIDAVSWNWCTVNDELATDAYAYAFIERLSYLRNAMKKSGNIDPLVHLMLNQMLTSLQRKADPLGYSIFTRLSAAVKLCIDRNQVFIVRTTRSVELTKIEGNTTLAFSLPSGTLTSREELSEFVCQWGDDLLPDLLLANGRAVTAVKERLADKILELKDLGVHTFSYGSLASELQNNLRHRWRRTWEIFSGEWAWPAEGEGGPVPVYQSENEFDQIIYYNWSPSIQNCIEKSINNLPSRHRKDLQKLWTWIKANRISTHDVGSMPSYTEIGEQTELHRGRVRLLFKRLRIIFENCNEPHNRNPDENRDSCSSYRYIKPPLAPDNPKGSPESTHASSKDRKGHNKAAGLTRSIDKPDEENFPIK